MSLFAEYDFDLLYRPRPQNTNADYLSRSSTKTDLVLSVGLGDDVKSVIEYLTTGMFTAEIPRFGKAIKVRAKNYVIYDGRLYRRTTKGLRFIPAEKERITMLKGFHDEIGHWNFDTTYKIISDRFWWPKIRPDISQFVRRCDPCH